MDNKLLEIISQRYSPLAFSEKNIADNDMEILFKAASRAPSAFNEQPWRFLPVRKSDGQVYRVLLDSLAELNKIWAKTAPVLMLVLAQKQYTHNGKENFFHLYDTGMAVGNLLAQAMNMGIYTHQMGGFNPEFIRDSLKISSELSIIAVMALGYPGDHELLPENLRQRGLMPGARKSLEEIVLHFD